MVVMGDGWMGKTSDADAGDADGMGQGQRLAGQDDQGSRVINTRF